MKPYYQDEWGTQYCGDALRVLPELPDESIDLLATDPPYGISFMGKDWDKALPDKSLWKECLRVLKPGAFAFVMSIPRSDCLSRMIINLEDAGFRVDFSPIYWAYASGFPKAQNIGKAVDKKPSRLKALAFRDKFNELRIQKGYSIREVNDYLGFAITGSGVAHHWFSHPTQPTVPDNSQYQILKEWWQLDNSLDDLYCEAEREITSVDSSWGQAGATPLTRYGEFERKDKPQSSQAKALDGSYGGFQPKPAVEVIIVAMKPLSEKTFVDQALKNNKGITWLDDCRIPYNGEKNLTEERYKYDINNDVERKFNPIGKLEAQEVHTSGRFPANLIVSDDVLNDGKDRGGGQYHLANPGAKPFDDGKGWNQHSMTREGATAPDNYGDSGSFSRYFDLDAWWAKTFPFLIVPKASRSEKEKGLDDLPEQKCRGDYKDSSQFGLLEKIQNSPRPTAKNFHPTVKPLKLMSYLITLGSRVGDIVLDPFLGSGTTAVACKQLNRKCIGIEIEEKYCEIAAKRCSQSVMRLDI